MYYVKTGYKRLNNCQAQYNENSFISYDTEIARFTYDCGKMRLHIWRYNSATSAQHLWKWFKKVASDYQLYNTILREWNSIVKKGCRYLIVENGFMQAYNDYENAKRAGFVL